MAILLPATEYGTDIHGSQAIVRPMLIEGQAGVAVQGHREVVIVTTMSPKEALRLGWDMIEIANRAESAKRAGATGSAGDDMCPTCGSRGPLECPICKC